MTLIKWHLLSVLAVSVTLTGGTIGLIAVQAADKKPQDGSKPAKVTPDGGKPTADGSKPKPAADGNKPKKPGADGDKPKKPGTDGDKPKASAEGEKKPGTRLTGRSNAVDAKAGTITLLTRTDKVAGEQTFKLAADARVLVDGKPARLADIPAGVNVEVITPENAKEATVVNAIGPRTAGAIARVDGKTLTLEARGGAESRGAGAYVLGADTNIMLDGRRATAADLKPGMQVGMQVGVDGKTVLVMKVGTNRDSEGRKPVKPDGDKPTAKPDGEKKPSSKADGEKKPSVKPDGEKKPSIKPDGEKKPSIKPDGEKKPGVKPDGEKKPAKPSGDKGTGQE